MNMSLEEILLDYWKNNENLTAIVDTNQVVTSSSSVLAIPFVRIVVDTLQEYCPTGVAKSPRFAEGRLELHCRSFFEGFDIIERIQNELNFLRCNSNENHRVILRFLRSKNICIGVNHWILSREFHVMFDEGCEESAE